MSERSTIIQKEFEERNFATLTRFEKTMFKVALVMSTFDERSQHEIFQHWVQTKDMSNIAVFNVFQL